MSNRPGTTSDVKTFFDAYRQQRQVATFFDEYRQIRASNGQLPVQNFLYGAGIIRESEVNWCRVLCWLLDPQTCRPLASEFQYTLCKEFAPQAQLARRQTCNAQREVRTDDGSERNDIILSNRSTQIVIEAKLKARYDNSQHEKYDRRWVGTANAILYVVRNRNSVDLHGFRKSSACEWSDIAELLIEVIAALSPVDSLDDRRWRLIAGDFADLIRLEVK